MKIEVPEWRKKEAAERLKKIKTGLSNTISEKETFWKLGWIGNLFYIKSIGPKLRL